jgi:hypothetical protein
VTSAGAGRNLIALLTLGRRVLSIDDDVCGPVLQRPPKPATWTPGNECVELSALSRSPDASWEPGNLIDSHFGWLGRSVGAFGAETVLTMSGLRGDCGADAPWHELRRSGCAGAKGRLTRQVIKGASRPTVTAIDGLMSYAFGFLNEGSLPPFMPMGRNQDGAFGAVLRAWQPQALMCHLPVYVVHAAGRRRSQRAYRDVAAAVLARWRTNDVIALLAGTVRAGSPTSHQDVATLLDDVAAELQRGTCATLQDLRIRYLAMRMQLAEPWIQARGWRTRRRFAAAVQRHTAAAAADVLPLEWSHGGTEALGRYLHSCALLLARWPAVIAAVRRISAAQSPWTVLTPAEGVIHVGAA